VYTKYIWERDASQENTLLSKTETESTKLLNPYKKNISVIRQSWASS